NLSTSMSSSLASARAESTCCGFSTFVLSIPNRNTGRAVTSVFPPAPRISPRSASRRSASSTSPSSSDGSAMLGANSTFQSSARCRRVAEDSYVQLRWSNRQVCDNVATATSPLSVTSETSTSCGVSPIRATRSSYFFCAWAVCIVVNPTCDRSPEASPSASLSAVPSGPSSAASQNHPPPATAATAATPAMPTFTPFLTNQLLPSLW